MREIHVFALLFFWSLSILLLAKCDVQCLEDTLVEVDGIIVDKTNLIQTRSEQKRLEETMRLKAKMDEDEALLYTEDQEFTKHLPNPCQVCRLLVTEIQRKLKMFGTVKSKTRYGRPIYYKDDMVLWNVFDELCIEMEKYNIDKKTPFRYRKDVKSYLRRKADEMIEHTQQMRWVWSIDEADIDDPTGELRRLPTKCDEMLVKHQDDIQRWFFTSQNSDPLKWLCAKRILKQGDSRGCLFIQDKYLEQLTQGEKKTNQESEHSDTDIRDHHDEL